jgi:gluconate:H+ symporter, GntP family
MVTGLPLLAIIFTVIVLVVIASSRFNINPFISLLLGGMLAGLTAGMPLQNIIPVLTKGFGEMAGNIGIIIIMGSIIGQILEKSGAAETIAETFISLTGRKRVVGAMSTIGSLIGIPVFCDSGYLLLSAPGKNLARKTGTNAAAVSIATATGLYATHVLVPPTPGPLAAAGNLGVGNQMGMVILMGLAAAIPATIAGYYWAVFAAKKITISTDSEIPAADAQLKLPPLWKSVMPILLPLVLIIAGTIVNSAGYNDNAGSLLRFFSNPNVALFAGAICGLFLLKHPLYKPAANIEEGIKQAGPILLITCAGGAFGSILKNLPLADTISQFLNTYQVKDLLLLPFLFLLTAGIKTAQGSSTAALVIVSSLLAPMLPALHINGPYAPAILVIILGAGAMTVSHTNDSYFWVISRFSGMTVKQTLYGFTIASLIQGVTTLLAGMLLWSLLV